MAALSRNMRIKRDKPNNNAGRENLQSTKKQLKKSTISKYVFYAFFIIIITAVCVWFCYDKFFVIKKCVLKYEGNLPYTEEQVLQKTGLDGGVHLYGFDKAQVARNVRYNLPYIDSFELKRIWPDTVVFEIQPALPSMYTVIGENAFVLSQSLRVLSQTKDFEYIESNQLVNVRINNVTSCVAGEYMQTLNDEGKTLEQLYKLLNEHDIIRDVDEIDVRNKFDMKFNYKSRFVVELGDKKNLDLKIRFMIAIEQKLNENQSGIIDVSDENAKEGMLKDF